MCIFANVVSVLESQQVALRVIFCNKKQLCNLGGIIRMVL